VTAHDFDSSILDTISHRPWPMPDRPWIMSQTWHDLLFAHWPIDAAQLRPLVPACFELEVFDGEAWVGVVPFLMTNVSLRRVPALPWVSEFPELNVRTYVRVADRPGVYFFSLDAGSRLAVTTARTLLNLPYHAAAMTIASTSAGVRYDSRRENSSAEFSGTYAPIGSPVAPVSGTLEYFLTERYCLYNVSRSGEPYRLDIHHPPWPLHAAQAELVRNTMALASHIALPDRAPLLHFSKRQDMVGWAPAKLEG
jgi:uncharacterized protein